MSFILTMFILYQCFEHTQTIVICTSGHCTIDCSSSNCDKVICTHSASSCIVHCGGTDCASSTMYLSANLKNEVVCDGSDSCKSSTFYCGIPDSPPTGYTSSDFNGHIDECRFYLTNNAISDNGAIKCVDNIDLCTLNVQSDNDDFKVSTFECELTPMNAQCLMDCYNDKACGSGTSEFICTASQCQCSGKGCDGLKTFTRNTPSPLPTTTDTESPTAFPTTNQPTRTPTTSYTTTDTESPTAFPTTNQPTRTPTTSYTTTVLQTSNPTTSTPTTANPTKTPSLSPIPILQTS
eukprot:743164_1